jgi:molybdate transport system ATP-binding protein
LPDIAAKIGVLPYEKNALVDLVLAEAVDRIQARGISVGGLLQRTGEPHSNGRLSIWLDDIGTGETLRLDQPRGPGAKDCIVDPDALAQAACLLRRAVEQRYDLIVVNRFGYAESEGGGMRAEIADAVCSDAVVLIAVRESRLAGLEGFLGGAGSVLPLCSGSIADWVERAVGGRRQRIAGQVAGV